MQRLGASTASVTGERQPESQPCEQDPSSQEGAPGCSRLRPPFRKSTGFSEGVDMFDVWVCLFEEDVELQKAKCFVTQKGTQ